jgi:serine/threonine protein kinase
MRRALDFQAMVRLPSVFMGSEDEQRARWALVAKAIEDVEEQGKLFRNTIRDLKYSIFCFEGDQGEMRYFLTPRTYQKTINTLGKGAEGYVIPGYELIRREDGTYLGAHDLPAVAIKIIKCGAEEFKKKSRDAKRQIAAIKKGYGEKLKILPTPFKRALRSNQEITYKIYLAMSYVPGMNGGDFIEFQKLEFQRRVNMPEADKNKYYVRFFLEALRYCISVMEEVNAFLEKGYLHCDIKPPNFLLLDGRATLIDFGFADTVEKVLERGRRSGTREFFAPEFFDQDNIPHSHYSERFSLGVTLYYLMGGQEKEEKKIDELYKKINATLGNATIKAEVKKEQKCTFDQNLLPIFQKGSDRVADNFLDNVPITFEQKTLLKEKIVGLMNVDPTKRPEIIEVKKVFERIEHDIIDNLTEENIPENENLTELWNEIQNLLLNQSDDLNPEPNPSDKGKKEADDLPLPENDSKYTNKNVANIYLLLYMDKPFGKEELDRMKIGSLQNDQLNYLCHVVSQNQVGINPETREIIISSLARFFNLKSESESEKIQGIIAAVNAENAKLDIVSRWQYLRIMKEYIDYKDSTFMGLGWRFQSEETEEAINQAQESKSPVERGRALIQNYYQAGNPGTFFRKSNQERALGKCISAIRPMPSKS